MEITQRSSNSTARAMLAAALFAPAFACGQESNTPPEDAGPVVGKR